MPSVARALVALAWLAGCGSSGTPAGDDAPASDSRCTESGSMLTCTRQSVLVGGRTVTFQVPLGAPPASGWPTVVFYQGSFVPGSHAFAASTGDAFGQYALTSTIKALLDRGYAVIAPNTLANGMQYWLTNIPPYDQAWTGCQDDVFVRELLAEMAGTTFGPLDAQRFYAMGISSGGFMTSRMAISYDGTFRALAIASGSYATCSFSCTVPELPADHPPTLFLHGGVDELVPVETMLMYRDQLMAQGLVTQAIVDQSAGHQWLDEGALAVPQWFDTH